MGKTRHPHADQSLEEGLYGLMHTAGFTSVGALSESSGVSARTIFNCHYGLCEPTNGTITLLAHALKVKTDRLRAVLGEQG
jgi:hypothetical protein